MTRGPGAFLAICLLLAPTASGQVQLTLEPVEQADHPPGPYRMARLTVSAAGQSSVSQVRLRWDEGGPTYILDMPVTGGAPQSRDLPLPAAWARQRYRAQIVAEGIDPSTRSVEIVWGNLQAREPFPDARMYDPFEQDVADWPGRLKRNLFLLLAVGALAGISATLLRSKPVRLLAVTAMVAGGSIGAWLLLREVPLISHRNFSVRAYAAELDLHVVTARRSAVWADTDIYLPRYRNFGQISDDRTEIHLGRGIRAPLRAGQLRVFQRIGPPAPHQRASSSSSSSSS